MFWIILFVIIIIVFAILVNRNSDKPAVPSLEAEDESFYEQLTKEKDKKTKEYAEEVLRIEEELSEYQALELQVAGIYYRSQAVKDEIPYLNVYDEIKLSKEPNNEYDCFAVKVMYNRKKMGYVPKEHSKLVTNLINEKRIYRVIIVKAGSIYVYDDSDPYMWIKIFYN